MNELFERVVETDTTLKLFLREGDLYSKTEKEFNIKIHLRIFGFKVALKRYLDIKYPTSKK